MRASAPRAARRMAIAGLAVGVSGIVSYFVVVFRFAAWLPQVRNDAVLNQVLVAIGLALSAAGVRRALTAPAGIRGRWVAPTLGVLNVAFAAAFAWLLYGMTAVPHVNGPALGVPAPEFALADQGGRPVRLADFRGQPLLLVFYRGHW